jgi:hypothetical protein
MKRIVLLTILATASPALAQNYCYEPSVPRCLTAYGTFDDEYSFDSCRREMTRYQSDVESYNRCLADWVDETVDEAQSKQSSAISQYDRAVHYWNCMADDPDGYCSRP